MILISDIFSARYNGARYVYCFIYKFINRWGVFFISCELLKCPIQKWMLHSTVWLKGGYTIVFFCVMFHMSSKKNPHLTFKYYESMNEYHKSLIGKFVQSNYHLGERVICLYIHENKLKQSYYWCKWVVAQRSVAGFFAEAQNT